MSNLAVVSPQEFTPDQIVLIKSTVAKGASDNEFQLFLYRCREMGLNPLKPGHIHFIKYGTNPGTIVIGIDGFRSKATQTGKHIGTKRGVLRDEKGKCIGAWCEVYRSDWTHPAREEVSLVEYNTGKAQWAKMPETMIKKVAEVAALRMAFPDELGGIYSDDEMEQAGNPQGQAKAKEVTEKLAPLVPVQGFEDEIEIEQSLSNYVRLTGKHKGKELGDVLLKEHEAFIKWFDEQESDGNTLHPNVQEDALAIRAYIQETHERGQP